MDFGSLICGFAGVCGPEFFFFENCVVYVCVRVRVRVGGGGGHGMRSVGICVVGGSRL